jgi:hypothetical protein
LTNGGELQMIASMPPEILALIDRPLSLIAVLFVGAFFGVMVEQWTVKQRRAEWRRKNSSKWQKKGRDGSPKILPFGKPEPTTQAKDSADQLRTVMVADFSVQSLLNKSEVRLFKELDRLVLARHPDWQVMAQVSLGEILKSKSKEAYAASIASGLTCWWSMQTATRSRRSNIKEAAIT